MTTLHLSLSPFFARTVTALALFRTIAPHFVLLRDAFETLEDGLDSILKRSLRALSAPRTYQEESDNEEEEEMRLVKHSADSIAALRAMEYRRGRRALVKDKFAKTLAGTKYVTNALMLTRMLWFLSRLELCVYSRVYRCVFVLKCASTSLV